MATDGNLPPDTVMVGVASSLVTAVLAWLGNRLVGKAAIQTAVTGAFKEVMDQMRQELRIALRERDEARHRQLELEGEIRQLKAINEALERVIVQHQLPLPPSPASPPPPAVDTGS